MSFLKSFAEKLKKTTQEERICRNPFDYKGVHVNAQEIMGGYCKWRAEIIIPETVVPGGDVMLIGDDEGGEISRSEIEMIIDRALRDPEKFRTGRDKRWILFSDKRKTKTAQQGLGEEPLGQGGTDICVCSECGYEEEHERGVPCIESTCPECGIPLVGKTAPIREEVTPEEELELLERLKSKGKLSTRISIDELNKLCPSCAETLKKKGIKFINLPMLGATMLEEEQKDKDKISYTFAEKNRTRWESYWASITGGEETFEACMDRLTGSSWIDDPTDFCTDLKKFVEGALEKTWLSSKQRDGETKEAQTHVVYCPYCKDPVHIPQDLPTNTKKFPCPHCGRTLDIAWTGKGWDVWAVGQGKEKFAQLSSGEIDDFLRQFKGSEFERRMGEPTLVNIQDAVFDAYESFYGKAPDKTEVISLADAYGMKFVPSFASLEIPRSIVAKICPTCAEEMEKQGIASITIKRGQLPKGWTTESVKKFWSSIGGSFTTCVEKLTGVAEVDNPEAFCAWMHEQAEGKWPAESSLKKSGKGLKPGEGVVLTSSGFKDPSSGTEIPKGSYGTIKKVLPSGDYEVEFVDKGGYVRVLTVMSDYIERSDIGASDKRKEKKALVPSAVEIAKRFRESDLCPSPLPVTRNAVAPQLTEYLKRVRVKATVEDLQEIYDALKREGIVAYSNRELEKEAEELIKKGIIVQEKGEWCVKSKDGKKSLGCYKTKGEAVKRLQQVEYFKSHPGEDKGMIEEAKKVVEQGKRYEKLHLTKLRLSGKENTEDVLKRQGVKEKKEAQWDITKEITQDITRMFDKGDTIPFQDIATAIARRDKEIAEVIRQRLVNMGYSVK